MSEYPPPKHILRDLNIEVEPAQPRAEAAQSGDTEERPIGPIVRMPVVRALQGPDGGVRAGVLGVVLDIFGGNLAVEAAAPDWALTSQLELHVLAPLREGTITVTGRPLRAGRTNLVAEARIDAGDTAAGHVREPRAVGRITFTRVPARGAEPPRARRGGLRYAFASGAERLALPFHEAIGLRVGDAAAGAVELSLDAYVTNSIGALQGGLTVALADACAERAGRAWLAREVVTTDLSLHFLTLGKVGPFRARTARLRHEGTAALLSLELRDAGQDDRLMAVATARVARVR